MDKKICSICKEDLPLNLFLFRKNRNLYDSSCRPCNAEKAREKRKNPEVREKMKKSLKKYHEKNKEKLNESCRNYHWKNKEALNEQSREYYKKNSHILKEKVKKHRKKIKDSVESGQIKRPNIKNKSCKSCGEEKPIVQFSFNKYANNYSPKCKDCNAEKERNRRELHGNKINARRREIKKPKTPTQKILCSLRGRVNGIIKNRNKRNLYLDLLGCDKYFLIKWFEYNFELDKNKKMNWDNYGDHWHIDHVTPCASFDMTQKGNHKVCFHWTNLSPVLKGYNLSKGSKIYKKDQTKQKERVQSFLNTFSEKIKYSIDP